MLLASARRASHSPWQAQHALGDHVPLHLGRTRVDRRGACPEVLVLPPARVERAFGAAGERGVRAMELDREVLETLVGLAPDELQVRALGARLPLPHHLGHLLVDEEADDLRLDEALREALAPAAIAGRARLTRERHHVAHLARDPRVRSRSEPL